MNINDLTYGEIKRITGLFNQGIAKSHNCNSLTSAVKSSNVFIMTLTFHYVGELVAEDSEKVILSGCSWVADSGRLGSAIQSGNLDEVEFLGDNVVVYKSNGTTVIPWKHDLPKESK